MPDMGDRASRQGLIERAYRAGINRVAPDEAVRKALGRDDGGLIVDDNAVPIGGKVLVIAIGKAAMPMATAAGEILGDRIDAGYLLTKEGHVNRPPAGFQVFEASHPVPDERGIEASRRILKGVQDLGRDDVVIALISGGGSALFEAPAGDLNLDDIQVTTDLLLRAGAPIQDLNAVRAELSQVKGGGFRRAIGEARTLSLILSDVLGNSPVIIASGPTVPREPNPKAALDVLDRYGVREDVPQSVVSHLEYADGRESTAVGGSDRDLYRIIGDNEAFVAAVEAYFSGEGFTTERVWHEREGEARDQAREWVDQVKHTEADVILGGGEMTVTVRGDGIGGRNTEFALAAAIELDRSNVPATVASLASDGQDGSIDAAGGVVDERTVNDLRDAGHDPDEVLQRNDSGSALATIGALIDPGPTGTNVGDVYIGLRHR